MKINIAASHRFHLLDLARELDSLGHEVRFYSYVPTKRAQKFGLKEECSYSLYYFMLPFLALLKITNRSRLIIKLVNKVLDLYLSLFMKRCDVYIALGTVYESSLKSAKRRFGATTILEWGSKHIDEQCKILSEVPGLEKQDNYFIKRAINGYINADFIAISSDHVKQSFIQRGFSETKLIMNNYGVDLSMFRPTILNSEHSFDVIMVGGWSYRKGCDLLIDYFKNSAFTLLHVGSIVDLPFPKQKNMTHVNSVNQKRLIDYYAKARVFVLPSREEGMAMVQPQALVCGLPIICTKDTGGRDLKAYIKNENWIIEMEEFSVMELDKCIKKALELSKSQKSPRSYAGGIVEQLSWSAYGERYNENLNRYCKTSTNR